MLNWNALTPREIWDALRSPPKVAGPWEAGNGGKMDMRRASDGTIIATTLWVVPKHPTGSWRVPVLTSDRAGADAILSAHGWMLVEDEDGRWGVFIPAQWVKGIMASSKEIATEVASKMLRGAFDYKIQLLPQSDTPAKPDESEVLATSLPSPSYAGWYCENHPAGEQLANAATRPRCWGCGLPKPTDSTPGPRTYHEA